VCKIFARERWLQVSGLLSEQAVRSKEDHLPDSLLAAQVSLAPDLAADPSRSGIHHLLSVGFYTLTA
jgi:hypothetical protein